MDVVGFDCQSVYDDDSRTDQILTKFDIKVQCVISDDSLDLLGVNEGVSSPADIISAVHAALMKPRQELSFKFSGVEFIPSRANVLGYVDARNGPQPQGFTPLRMEPGSWVLMYHVVAHYRVNLQMAQDGSTVTFTNLPGNVVLYNRWRERVDIDHRDYSKRVRSGKFMIRSDNTEGYVADQVRTLMGQVGVPEGCVRNRRSYTVSPDGLAIQYEVEDQEVWMMPPQGAFRAHGRYQEEASTGDGKRIGTCRVTLEGRKVPVGGNPLGSYAGLIKTACALVVAKLDLQGANFLGDLNVRRVVVPPQAVPNGGGFRGGNAFGGRDFIDRQLGINGGGGGGGVKVIRGERATLLSASIDVGMWDNTVTAMMRVLYPSAGKTIRGVAFINPATAVTPSVTQTQPQVPYTARGTAGFLLRAAAYYDPDLGARIVLAQGQDRSADNPPEVQGGTKLSRGAEPGQGGQLPE